jgi:hypothetical protein
VSEQSVDELMAAYVRPYYLKMMGVNAGRAERSVLASVKETSRTVTADTVLRLLRHDWRERVMGAWYAARVGGPEVTTEVLGALQTSQGSLDAPALATAAVVLAGPDSLDAIEHYHPEDEDGATTMSAAADYLRERYHVTSTLSPAEPAAREVFDGLVEIAERIRGD